MKKKFLFFLPALFLLMSGCGTIIMRPKGAQNMGCYPAITYDLYNITSGGGIYAYGDCNNGLGPVAGWCLVVPLHIIDLPLSFVTDTIFLPFDIRRVHREADEHSREFTLNQSSANTKVPDLLLVATSREGPAVFRFLPTGEITSVFSGHQLEFRGMTGTYTVVWTDETNVILRTEMQKPSREPSSSKAKPSGQ